MTDRSTGKTSDPTTGESTDPANGRATARDDAPPDGFVDFFRRYARTWVHAVATAGLTAFGTLTVVHRGFAALALAAYVVPPVALYLSGSTPASEERLDESEPSSDGPTPKERGTAPDSEPHDDRERDAVGWTSADTPVDVDLYDAVVTSETASAVGETGVVVADDGDGWSVVLEDGPGADRNALRGVDATADGAALWVAGDGGALGRLDAGTGRHVDLSAPEGITDDWVDVGVAGDGGSETVLLVNGSGEVLRGSYRDGEVAWTPPRKPGSGSSFSGVDFVDSAVGYLCDTNDGVYRTVDAGETFERVGIEGPDGTLTGVAALGEADCLVAADDGAIHRYNGSRWTPETVADGALLAIAGDDEYVVCCGEGAVHERSGRTSDWERSAVPASATLRGIDVGRERAVTVGNGGTVVVRAMKSR